MIHLRVWKYRFSISKLILRIAAGIALAAAVLVGLYAVGATVTPASATDRPPILSPSLWATERYRARVRGWISDLEEIDRRLTDLSAKALNEATANELYTHGREMQAIGEATTLLLRRVNETDVPVSMLGLQAQVEETTHRYLEAALMTARWLDAPLEENQRSAVHALERARESRKELEENKWVSSDLPSGIHRKM